MQFLCSAPIFPRKLNSSLIPVSHHLLMLSTYSRQGGVTEFRLFKRIKADLTCWRFMANKGVIASMPANSLERLNWMVDLVEMF